MKTINIKSILFLAVVTAITFTSCGDDFFNTKPKSSLSDATFWKTEADVEMGLIACYKDWEGLKNIVWMDMAGGNGYSQFAWDAYQAFGNGTLNASSAQVNLFSYGQITKHNTFLEKVENVEMDNTKKERYKAEVRFLRAYNYFRRVMYYGDCPLVTKTFASPTEANLPRDPEAKVKEFIVTELSEIADKLPEQNEIQSGGHITRGAAYALLARMQLFMEDYAGAMKSAKKVIDMTCFELYPDYLGIWLAENNSSNKEIILSVQCIRDLYAHDIWQHNLPAAEGGWSSVNISKNLVDAYEMDNGKPITDPSSGYDEDKQFENRDPRFALTVLHPGQPFNGRIYNTLDETVNGKKNPDFWSEAAAPRTGLSMKKYLKVVPSSEFGNCDANIPVIRLAEVYLTYAEAAEKVGTAEEKKLALDLINLIRNRVNHVKATTLTEDLVRRERRVELCFEGLWYYDVKRWNLGATELGQPLYGTAYGSVNNTTGEITWNKKDGKLQYIKVEDRTFITDRNYLFMIPQAEMDANPNMTQNKGY